MNLETLQAFTAEITKQASAAGALGATLAKGKGIAGRVGQHLERNSHAYDLAGLGVLAAPSAVELGSEAQKARKGGKVNRGAVGKGLAEVGGLGILAAPVAASMLARKH